MRSAPIIWQIQAKQFPLDSECGSSNPAAPGRQSGLRPPRRESPSKPRGTAAIRGYCLVSVSRIGAIEALTLELRNLGEAPVRLYPAQTIAQLFFSWS
jgi:hypothetical protein